MRIEKSLMEKGEPVQENVPKTNKKPINQKMVHGF
jgi:hypothetical protein